MSRLSWIFLWIFMLPSGWMFYIYIYFLARQLVRLYSVLQCASKQTQVSPLSYFPALRCISENPEKQQFYYIFFCTSCLLHPDYFLSCFRRLKSWLVASDTMLRDVVRLTFCLATIKVRDSWWFWSTEGSCTKITGLHMRCNGVHYVCMYNVSGLEEQDNVLAVGLNPLGQHPLGSYQREPPHFFFSPRK